MVFSHRRFPLRFICFKLPPGLSFKTSSKNCLSISNSLQQLSCCKQEASVWSMWHLARPPAGATPLQKDQSIENIFMPQIIKNDSIIFPISLQPDGKRSTPAPIARALAVAFPHLTHSPHKQTLPTSKKWVGARLYSSVGLRIKVFDRHTFSGRSKSRICIYNVITQRAGRIPLLASKSLFI